MIKLRALPGFIKVVNELNRFNKKIPTLQKIRAEGDLEKEREFIRENMVIFANNVSNYFKIKYEFIDVDNIPLDRPFLMVSNHQGFADILAVLAMMGPYRQMSFVAKEEWKKVTPLAKAIEYTRGIFLDRGNPRAAVEAIKIATELFEKGFALTIYPEGTRSQKHEMGEFKPGALKFAQKAGVPIVPISIDGSYTIYEKQGFFKPGTIRIKVHPLVEYGKMDRKEQKQAAIDIERTIREGLEEIKVEE